MGAKSKQKLLIDFVTDHAAVIGKLIDFNTDTDRLFQLDLTANNPTLTREVLADTSLFSTWVKQQLGQHQCKYGIGGYLEHRAIYTRSALFDDGTEARCLHLGVDIWADAGTPVYAPLAGHIHSFNDNNHFGDYGPTIIVTHQLNGLQLYSLYGHLNREALNGLHPGKVIHKNELIGHFGNSTENGNWPPHLHFQLMFDMEGKQGDYPGVCALSQREQYAANVPNPDIILRLMQYAIKT